MLVDSHAHLNFSELLDNLPQVLQGAKDAGVEKIVCVGTTVGDSIQAAEIAEANEMVYASVGIHPHEEEVVDWEKLEQLFDRPKVVAIGECGLDFSRLDKSQADTEVARQKELFRRQIELARKHDLPLVIHVRDAYSEIMNEFEETLNSLRGVFHCFSGTADYAQFVLDKLPGFYLSFAGNITFKNAHSIRNLAKITPLQRLLVETDSPFLSPEPKRGLGNTPTNVKITARRLAEVKGVTDEEIAEITSKNAINLFHL